MLEGCIIQTQIENPCLRLGNSRRVIMSVLKVLVEDRTSMPRFEEELFYCPINTLLTLVSNARIFRMNRSTA